MKVALYARVSTRDRDQDPETQLIKLRKFAAGQGWEIVKEYVDHASGADPNRPALKELRIAASKRDFEKVLIVRLDRIMRSARYAHDLLGELELYDVALVCTDQMYDTSTPVGRLLRNILLDMAEFERELARDRSIDGQQKARSKGKRIGRPERKIDVEAIRNLLEETGSEKKTAEILGVPRSTLRAHLRRESESRQRNVTENGGGGSL